MKRTLLTAFVAIPLLTPAAHAEWRGGYYHNYNKGIGPGVALGLGALALGGALALSQPHVYVPPYYAPPPVYYTPAPACGYYYPCTYIPRPPSYYYQGY